MCGPWGVWIAIGAAVGGCSGRYDGACNSTTGALGEKAKPESALLGGLSFKGAIKTIVCGQQPAGAANGPQPTLAIDAPAMVVQPGSTFLLGVRWSGGSIDGLALGFGSGAFVKVPVATSGEMSGATAVPVSIASDVCEHLPSICHALVCCQQVVNPAGVLSRAAAMQMVLDCTGGVGCPGNPGPIPPGACGGGTPCGAVGEACCSNATCNTGAACQNGVCVLPSDSATGDPCSRAADCAGTNATCITKDSLGGTWPGGYCTSACNPQKNDPGRGVNAGCPGGAATCVGSGNQGACETACTAIGGGLPCLRMGYSCFSACEPTARSECDPTMKGSCAQDGGATLVSDAGTRYSGRTCFRIGADKVGACTNGCDPFKQDCASIMMMPASCYASNETGEGLCAPEFGANQGDGVQCLYLNSCDPGLACYAGPTATMAVCRPYCGGPNAVACGNAMKKVCVDLSMTVKVSTMGVCGG